MIKKDWIWLIIILVILGGFYYFNQQHSTPINWDLDPSGMRNFSDKDIGISFDYPNIWGIPKIYKEGDILTENSPYSHPYIIPKGKFIIDFPASLPFVYIEGFNNDYVMVDSSDDPLGYEEFTSCALYYLKHKDDSFYLYKNLKLNNILYSISIHEEEGRYGLFGDKILNTNEKYPSICATLVLDRTGIGSIPKSKLLSQIISEKAPEYVLNDGRIMVFKKVLSGEYLKGLSTETKKSIDNFEKFSASIKVF